MMAYLSMMAPRLIELQRVLKATGSIYLHCDPTASHYLKMLMDAVFGSRFPERDHLEASTPTVTQTRAEAFGTISDTCSTIRRATRMDMEHSV